MEDLLKALVQATAVQQEANRRAAENKKAGKTLENRKVLINLSKATKGEKTTVAEASSVKPVCVIKSEAEAADVHPSEQVKAMKNRLTWGVREDNSEGAELNREKQGTPVEYNNAVHCLVAEATQKCQPAVGQFGREKQDSEVVTKQSHDKKGNVVASDLIQERATVTEPCCDDKMGTSAAKPDQGESYKVGDIGVAEQNISERPGIATKTLNDCPGAVELDLLAKTTATRPGRTDYLEQLPDSGNTVMGLKAGLGMPDRLFDTGAVLTQREAMTASLDTPKGAGRPPDSPEEIIADIGRWPLKAEQAEGNPKEESCTIVLRIAPTFLRFGSFEIFKETDELTGRGGPSVNRNDVCIQMIDYVISTFYPDIQNTHAEHKIERNAAFFREITRRTARLVAEWQCVGFCHGVLNTDNMSIVGITIDYGPYGFMDRYDPDHICNGSDNIGRYAYNKQPEICKWNLGKLAESLVPEFPVEISQSIIDEEYDSEFQRWYMQKMRKKLGLIQAELEEDSSLISDLLETMNKMGANFTNTFRVLSKYAGNSVSAEDFLDILTEQYASLDELKVVFKPKMDPRQLSVMLMLAQSNPQLFALIGAKANICKELDRIERYNKLQESSEDQLLSNDRALWEEWLHKYSTRLSKDQATTGDNDTFVAERVKIMDSNNPAFVLRNYIAQNSIDAAEKGDFSEVQRVLRMLENPYDVEVSFQLSPDEAGDEDDELEEEAD
ncbi:protein adenylyltransferase SelO, mitochondrial-like [Pelobates fuscus]|uniref:protein adenylyltransferase SelO, mitochondrial-like n=1 Tax=Pelobates fuscus TaxID=191477 RepID=UPI002FE4D1E2